MSFSEALVYALTALGALAIVLTRLRLSRGYLPSAYLTSGVMSPPTCLATVLTALISLALPLSAVEPASAAVASSRMSVVRSAPGPGVVEVRLLGRSVKGRRIFAYHLGGSGSGVKRVVLMSTMHGDEPATRQILRTLVEGPEIRGVDLWVVPTYNPDGLARGTRKNANGVDLNRNYPSNWADLDGRYESGPKPASEPETQAMMRFLRDVRPHHILSFHQPLYGVDTDTKNPRFARRVADKLNLPVKRFDCGGVCHGTMTGWYNRNFSGDALTVEYGANPSQRLMTRVAPRQVLSIFGAWRVRQ